MAFNFLKALRDAGKITDDELATGNIEFESAVSGLRKSDKRTKELEKELDETNSILESIFDRAGINADDEDAPERLSSILEGKGKPNSEMDAKLKGFERQIKELSDGLAKEKAQKIEALKNSQLQKHIGSIDGLDPRYKKLVEFELSQALKIGESGDSYFESEGASIDSKSYLDGFIAKNPNYLLPKGSIGTGQKGGYSGAMNEADYFNPSSPNFNLTKQAEILKTNPALFNQLKG